MPDTATNLESPTRRCNIYANIKEEARGGRVTICSGNTRFKHVYTTVSSSVEIQIVNTGENGDESAYFAIAFQGILYGAVELCHSDIYVHI